MIISADSTCDLSPELIEKHQIKILPLYITFGETSYKDGIEITPDDLYARYESEGVLPKTSAIPIGEFTDYFETLLQEADQVIHFCLGSALSCTFQNAMLAAEEFPGQVFPVDTENLSSGEALTIIRAAEMLAAGATAEEIVAFAAEYRTRVDASFIVESLEFLYKGGRCNALASFGSNLLSIKPCIEVQNGKMDVGKKYRGKFLPVLQKYVEERLASGNFETDRIFVTHAGCQDEIVDAVKQQVEATGIFKEVLVARAGCTISAHCGPNTLGLLFVRKN
ncbi:MAG: DegV family protein [Ruminococcaceae bacterium]|nr:DegV family protein [Oscillospiraceae bacterium]